MREARGESTIEGFAFRFDVSGITVADWESGALPVPWEHAKSLREMRTDAAVDAAIAKMTLPTCEESAAILRRVRSDNPSNMHRALDLAFEESERHERSCATCKEREHAIVARLPPALRRHYRRYEEGRFLRLFDKLEHRHPIPSAAVFGGVIGVGLMLVGTVLSLTLARPDIFRWLAYAPPAFAALGGLGGATFVTLRRRTSRLESASRYVSGIGAIYVVIGTLNAIGYFGWGESLSGDAWDTLKTLLVGTVLGAMIGEESEWEPDES